MNPPLPFDEEQLKEQILVKDLRSSPIYWKNTAYVDKGYANYLKPAATAVYDSLCRHAVFNSKELRGLPEFDDLEIANEQGMSPRTVREKMKILEDHKLVVVLRKRSADGKFLKNHYYLTNPTNWRKIPEPSAKNRKNSPSAKSANPPYNPPVNSNLLFNSSSYIHGLVVNQRIDLQLIGRFAQISGKDFESRDHASLFITKNVRAASKLKRLKREKVIWWMKFFQTSGIYPDWTLETILKCYEKDAVNLIEAHFKTDKDQQDILRKLLEQSLLREKKTVHDNNFQITYEPRYN